MTNDHESRPRPATPAPRFRLRYEPIFGRVAIAAFVILEVVYWLEHVRPKIPFRPRYRRILHMAYVTPQFFFYALLIAAIVTVVSDVVFRLLVRPLMRNWYHPRCYDPSWGDPMAFRLGVGEEVLEECPGRRLMGRRKLPGTVVRTNRRVYFFPYTWDVEGWCVPYEHVEKVELVTPRRRVLGWVTGYPDHLLVTEDSGEQTTLILADPVAARGWFGSPERGAGSQDPWRRSVPLG